MINQSHQKLSRGGKIIFNSGTYNLIFEAPGILDEKWDVCYIFGLNGCQNLPFKV
jgi:hypothetical protein